VCSFAQWRESVHRTEPRVLPVTLLRRKRRSSSNGEGGERRDAYYHRPGKLRQGFRRMAYGYNQRCPAIRRKIRNDRQSGPAMLALTQRGFRRWIVGWKVAGVGRLSGRAAVGVGATGVFTAFGKVVTVSGPGWSVARTAAGAAVHDPALAQASSSAVRIGSDRDRV